MYLLSILLYPLAILVVSGLGLLAGASTLYNLTLSILVAAAGPPALIFFLFGAVNGALLWQRRGPPDANPVMSPLKRLREYFPYDHYTDWNRL